MEVTTGLTAKSLRQAWRDARNLYRGDIRRRRLAQRETRNHTWRGPLLPGTVPGEERYTQVGQRICGVRTTANSVYREYLKKLWDNLGEDKEPPTLDTQRWVSVEIECLIGKPEDELYRHLLPLGKYICVKSDSSIKSDPLDHRSTPKEIVVTAPAKDIDKIIKKVCDAIEECNGYVNETCGLHIHLDMRYFDRRAAYSNLVAGQKILQMLVPEHRVNNRYCKPVRNRTWPLNDNRYKAINHTAWNRYRTLEVRIFSGCINADKISNYIRICSAIAYADKVVKRAPRTIEGWKRVNPKMIDASLINFVKTEQAKFAREEAMAQAEPEQNIALAW
jgi:hypothetical protein